MNTNDAKVKKSLKVSFKEGVFTSAMTGFTHEYFTPFLLLLGGTVRHVGFLSAFPNLIAAVVQLKSADIVERINSRKKVITIFVFLQSMMFVPMIVVALFKQDSPAIFITMVVLFTCCGALAHPAWGSLMSDLVHKDKKGQYFGWRNRTLGFVTAGAMFLAGFLLYLMKKVNVFAGFALLFSFAFIWRMLSWHFLNKIHEPRLHNNGNNHFSLLQFLRRLKES
ncbi:MAG: MFS transporter, partial [Candidatus Omnitrophota bacterium]